MDMIEADIHKVVNLPSDKPPVVSVLVTTYNQADYIEQALRSVFAQETDVPVEVLVGDDRSSDATSDKARMLAGEAPGNCTVFSYKDNIGGHRNLDFLWRRAGGRYIAWLEGDDFWTDPAKLRRQVAALDANRKATICFHRCSILSQSTGQITGVYPVRAPPVLKFRHLVYGNPIMTPTVMYKRGVMDGIPRWIWRLRLGDWPVHLLHAVVGDVVFLEETMAVYRAHDKGLWSSLSAQVRIISTMEVLTEVRRHLPKHLQAACDIAMQDMCNDLRYLAEAASEKPDQMPPHLDRAGKTVRGRLARYVRERDRRTLLTEE